MRESIVDRLEKMFRELNIKQLLVRGNIGFIGFDNDGVFRMKDCSVETQDEEEKDSKEELDSLLKNIQERLEKLEQQNDEFASYLKDLERRVEKLESKDQYFLHLNFNFEKAEVNKIDETVNEIAKKIKDELKKFDG